VLQGRARVVMRAALCNHACMLAISTQPRLAQNVDVCGMLFWRPGVTVE